MFWCLRSTENGVLQVGASQYMAALIIGFVNSATIQARPAPPCLALAAGAGLVSNQQRKHLRLLM